MHGQNRRQGSRGRWGVPWVLLLSTAVAQTPEIPARLLAPLRTAARELAQANRPEDVAELLGILRQLGTEDETLEALRRTCDLELARNRRRRDPVPDIARTLRQTADRLARSLAGQDVQRRNTLARLLVALHGDQGQAREVLGQEKVYEGWYPGSEIESVRRRGELQDIIRQAHHIPIQFSVGESSHPLIEALGRGRAIQLRWGDTAVHSMLSLEMSKRIVTQALRASAVAEWLVTGALNPRPFDFDPILVSSRRDYERAIQIQADNEDLEVWEADAARSRASFVDKNGDQVLYVVSEAHAEGLLFAPAFLDDRATVLSTGLINLVCMAFLHSEIPGPADASRRPRPAFRVATGGEDDELFELDTAGLLGSKAWMHYLASRQEDPPWSRILHAESREQITGLALLKNTLIVQYLCEREPLTDLKSRIRLQGSGLPPSLMEEALGQSLDEFEDAWLAWLTPPPVSLATRLETPNDRAARDAMMTRLNELRGSALTHPSLSESSPVRIDESLSHAAALHARYLILNSQQLDFWPDAREEHADRDGFTPAGAAAGRHSWVSRDGVEPQTLIEEWMGTFYRRLSLLNPGLVRVGLGIHDRITALDTGSMVKPVPVPWTVVWPYDGMEEVPTRFRGEMPSPIAGADPSKLGYPVTLQLGQFVTGQFLVDPEAAMTLHEGSADGPEVSCHISNPSEPGNPELVPPRAYGLFPRSTLKESTTYVVVARITGVDEELVWSFTTR